MSWARGSGTVEQELARCQYWIEDIDPELNGKNGDKGVIREFREDKAANAQRDADLRSFMKFIAWFIGIAQSAGLVAIILRAAGVIK